MSKPIDLQDLFLARARRAQEPVTLFLMNGFQLRGKIVGFDAFVVVVDSAGKQQVIYKHAISTIAPEHPVELTSDAT
ncbi:MAG: RNA chaperone Hfq [Pseudoflavonifractor sp.]|nr:RNA chaperone Hfq [Pseudoflavonifractor sp.]